MSSLGESFTSFLFTLFLVCFVSFAWFCLPLLKNTKNLVPALAIAAVFGLPTFAKMNSAENTKLCDFTSTNNNDFLSTPIDPPAPDATFYEIKPALLNLVMREQFSGASSDDAAAHLNNFVELCEMQKYKDVDGDIIKLKIFPFSLRGCRMVVILA